MYRVERGAIEVVDYDRAWAAQFESLRSLLATALGDSALSIEHVGSTAVPGLAAKPIIDIDIVVASSSKVPTVIQRLATLGYLYQGNMGIEDRGAFKSPTKGDQPAHHLYVCTQDSVALKDHLVIRDFLRSNPEAAARYGALKKNLATRFPNRRDQYVDGKTQFLLKILEQSGFSHHVLSAIAEANRAKS